MPEQITERAMSMARLRGFDVVILDTAGRLGIDEQLMAEVERISSIANPAEIPAAFAFLVRPDLRG